MLSVRRGGIVSTCSVLGNYGDLLMSGYLHKKVYYPNLISLTMAGLNFNAQENWLNLQVVFVLLAKAQLSRRLV